MARLIRTEKEVEGRYEEVWLVVEEDALDQWPEGPLEIVGQAVPRIDGPQRARGEARYTADLQLPGMLHTAVLRSPHAHARVAKIERSSKACGLRCPHTAMRCDSSSAHALRAIADEVAALERGSIVKSLPVLS